MRIGVMGGTLDPVHCGHLQLAEAALKLLQLDQVMLLPAGDPPHKSHPTLKMDRLEMARLAAQETERIFCCGIEVYRDGTTYTVDTLKWLHQNNPNVEWYYIIGSDTLEVLHTWRNFEEVAKLCIFAVAGRANDPADQLRIRKLQDQYGARFEVMGFNGPDISSTIVREKAARGESLEGLVPTSVCDYIKDHGLYICSCSRKEMIEKLRASLKPGRFQHTLGVAETAKALAQKYGVDPVRAEFAGLLHDCAKYMPLEDMRRLVRENVPDVDAQEMETANVLHAPAGAVYAAKFFGVQDTEILSAIRKHTLGDAQMSAMDALIYTADFIEPGREAFEGLDEARQLAWKDLFAATRRCAELTNAYLKIQGRRPHPRSLAMLENLI